MGDELVSDSFSANGDGQNKSVPVSFYSEFEKRLPAYLAMGMPAAEYWDDDCRLAISYRKAHEIRTSRINQEAWLNGMYIYDALCCVSPVLHAFAKNGTKPIPYLNEPYPITSQELADQAERKKREEYEKKKSQNMKWAMNVNAYFAKGGEADG